MCLGRFLSADPAGHGVSPSLYDYASGDPINRFDPDGRLATKFATYFDDPLGNAGLLNDIYKDVQAINDFNAQNSAERSNANRTISEQLEWVDTVEDAYTNAYNKIRQAGGYEYSADFLPKKVWRAPDSLGLGIEVQSILDSEGYVTSTGGTTFHGEIEVHIGNPTGELSQRIIYEMGLEHEKSHKEDYEAMKAKSGSAAADEINTNFEMRYNGEIRAYERQREYLLKKKKELGGK